MFGLARLSSARTEPELGEMTRVALLAVTDVTPLPAVVSIYTKPAALVFNVPAVVVERVRNAVLRFVDEAVRNDE